MRILGMLGMEVKERLVRRDDAARTLVYSIDEVPIPLEHAEATITVAHGTTGTGSSVTWAIDIKPDEMTDMFLDIYRQSLEALRGHVDGAAASSDSA